MQRISFTGADPFAREIEQLIARAKIARTQFLYGNRRRALPAIGWSALACGLALISSSVPDRRARAPATAR